MLARAARRQRRPLYDFSRTTLERPIQRCSCSALVTYRSASNASAAPYALRESRAPSPTPPLPLQSSRSIGTAAEAYNPSSDGIPPYAFPQSPSQSLPFNRPHDVWDASGRLNIPGIYTTRPQVPQRKAGIGGDPIELQQNCMASLKVGRFDRAASCIARLESLSYEGSLEVRDMHSEYLTAMLESLESEKPTVTFHDMKKWFETKVRHKIIPDEQTLVTMIRATLKHHPVEGRDGYVLMLLDDAMLHNIHDNVMSNGEYTSEEWVALLRLQPDLFAQPTSDVVEGDEKAKAQTIMPVARAPEQRGVGLKSLKESLASLDAPNQTTNGEKALTAREEQLQLEENVVEASLAKWRHDVSSRPDGQGAMLKKSLAGLTYDWFADLKQAIDEEKAAVAVTLKSPLPKADHRFEYGPYLELFTSESLAAVAIVTTLQAFSGIREKDTVTRNTVVGLATSIGRYLSTDFIMRVQAERRQSAYLAELAAKRKVAVQQLVKDRVIRSDRMRSGSARKLLAAEEARKAILPQLDSVMAEGSLPAESMARVGAVLLEKLIASTKLDVTVTNPKNGQETTMKQPAFSHGQVWEGGKRLGKVHAHHRLMEILKKEPIKAGFPNRLPMLVPPRPWKGFTDGGYLKYPVPVIRLKGMDDLQKAYALSAAKRGDLNQVFEGLDILGKTPWLVNEDILRVVTELWNTGEAVANLAPENPNLPLPPDPGPDADLRARRKWLTLVKDVENAKQGYHSNRCFQNSQIHIARSYLGRQFYTPHNVDYRGRAYPIPGLFNHMGADLNRSLLVFAKGKELGTVGLKWLKIHLANLAGYDKASLSEREEFTMQHLPEIYDSANNPIDGKRWWMESEDPFQTLGACFELRNALESPDPTRFVSHLPVHQDGTCNGLQHYAALGGDRAGAAQVNLEPGDRPADVYSAVADLVRQSVRDAAENGDKVATVIKDLITRKVVKQTVMTNVYGVTFRGASEQVRKQLAGKVVEQVENGIHTSTCAAYIAREIFKALGVMFSGAREIQFWLGECASRISMSISAEQIAQIEAQLAGKVNVDSDPRYKLGKIKKVTNKVYNITNISKGNDFKSPVIWTTPLKMPVVQPYRKDATKVIKTSLQDFNIRNPAASDPVSKRKQLQGFPPNFIHSLDASHMFLAAHECDARGLTFAAVHDSFWTHACDVPTMNTAIRDAFVKMHSEDIIGRLASEFEARYGTSMYKVPLNPSSSVAKKIHALRYSPEYKAQVREHMGEQVAKSALADLFLERQRTALLASRKAEDREKGQSIVTPTSIFLSASASPALTSSAKDHALLGDVTGKAAIDVKEKSATADAQDQDQGEATPVEADAQDQAAADESSTSRRTQEQEDFLRDSKFVRSSKPEEPEVGRKQNRSVNVWLPLQFPPVPKKGDFDVTRLKSSQYFFS